MKKYIFAIAAIAMMFATSCNKESVNGPETPTLREPNEGEFLAIIDAGAIPQNTPRRISVDMTTKTHIGDDGYVFWDSGDLLQINGNSYSCTDFQDNRAIFSGTGVVSSPFNAFYGPVTQSAEYSDQGTLLSTRTYDCSKNASSLPMYATSTNNTLTFSNICGVLQIIVPLSEANKIVVTTNEPNNGAFTLSPQSDASGYYQAVITATTVADGNNEITVTKEGNGYFQNGETIYVAMPARVYTKLNIQFKDNDNLKWQTGESTKSYEVKANKIHFVDFLGLIKKDGVLPGEFSVSSSKKVYFTIGNLYYDGQGSGTNATWRMDNTQEYVEQNNSNHRGLFIFKSDFSTSAVQNGVSNPKPDGSLFCNESHKGTVYVVTSQSHVDNSYCLSSHEEWENLFSQHKLQRPSADCILIVAPDGYNMNAIPNYKKNNEDYANIEAYTRAGFLVLPNCGFKRTSDTNVVVNTTNGARYWTGEYDSNASGGNDAYIVSIEPISDNLKLGYKVCLDTRANARGIRLVVNVGDYQFTRQTSPQ